MGDEPDTASEILSHLFMIVFVWVVQRLVGLDPATFEHTFGGILQLLMMMVTYGYILYQASGLIGDGSELLLLIPSLSGVVGSVVLPVLGAVPDAAIIVFSGLGPKDEAQVQLNVGVGALAGSTIMLLTVPWVLCLVSGRVNLDADGVAAYHQKPKLNPPGFWSWSKTGVTARPSIARNAKIMLFTTLPLILIQGSAFSFDCYDKKDDVTPASLPTDAVPYFITTTLLGANNTRNECKAEKEKWFAFAGLMSCLVGLIGYLIFQAKTSGDEDNEDKVNLVKQKAIEDGRISLSGAFASDLLERVEKANKEEENSIPLRQTASTVEQRKARRFQDVLRSFFVQYDVNRDGTIDADEFASLLQDFGERVPANEQKRMMAQMDTDGDGSISFAEFTTAMTKYIQNVANGKPGFPVEPLPDNKSTNAEEGALDHGGDDEDSEEEEEVPEDLKGLDPDAQKRRVFLRSLWQMGLGTFIILLFSDPMVDCLSEVGNRLKVSPFYVSFVLAPLASNASELIASMNYAAKKTKKTITISFATLVGAAIMNNTFCLAAFLGLVWGRGLAWEFSAETIAILAIQISMFFVAHKRTQPLYMIFIVGAMYPACVVIVAGLEAAGLN